MSARELARMGPVDQFRAGRLTRRLSQLYVGLVLYGLTLAMMIRASLGNAPWDVLHQGLSFHLPMTIGQAVIVVSAVVLLLWIPLREIPGIGTVSNAVVIGLSADLFLGWIDVPGTFWGKAALMLGGIALNGLATALYIGAQFGAGPRDGLMTGLNRRTGIRIGPVRTVLEISAVAIGWVLGGVVGVGTLLYALLIGPLAQWLLPIFTVEVQVPASRPVSPDGPVTDGD